MKKIFNIIIPTVAVVLALASCNSVMDDKAEIDAKHDLVGEKPAIAITETTENSTSIAISGVVSNLDNVIEVGVRVSTSEDMSNASYGASDVVDTEFVATADKLTPSTTYYVQAYAMMADNSIAVSEVQTATTLAPETWTCIGVGDYAYTLLFGEEDDPAIDPGLELYQNDKDPTRYKIEHWGYDVTFTFSMDEDGNILVDEQETGYVDANYGMIYIDDLVDYTGGTNYGSSYYDEETNTFNFAIVYYVEAGEFGYGYETFTLNPSSEVKSHFTTVASAPKKMRTNKIVGNIELPVRFK